MYIFSLLNYVIFFFIFFGLDQNGEDSRESPGGVSSLLGVGSNLFHHIESPTGGTARVCPNTIMGFVLCLSLSLDVFFFLWKKEEEEEKVMLSSILDRQGSSSFFGGDSLWPYLGEYMNYSRMIPSAIQGSAP